RCAEACGDRLRTGTRSERGLVRRPQVACGKMRRCCRQTGIQSSHSSRRRSQVAIRLALKRGQLGEAPPEPLDGLNGHQLNTRANSERLDLLAGAKVEFIADVLRNDDLVLRGDGYYSHVSPRGSIVDS